MVEPLREKFIEIGINAAPPFYPPFLARFSCNQLGRR
jgi:hypothetical protein